MKRYIWGKYYRYLSSPIHIWYSSPSLPSASAESSPTCSFWIYGFLNAAVSPLNPRLTYISWWGWLKRQIRWKHCETVPGIQHKEVFCSMLKCHLVNSFWLMERPCVFNIQFKVSRKSFKFTYYVMCWVCISGLHTFERRETVLMLDNYLGESWETNLHICKCIL